MYAANKYMLPKLVRECGKCLSEGLNVSNVIHVLEQSSLFSDNELKSKCLQLITQNAKAILTGSEILSASPQAMETILNIDKLSIKEIVVYETCVAWAKYHLHIQRSTENSTDEMIREILGGLLYQIRFPTMELTEFAEISEGKSILTADEKVSIYYFLATNKKGSGFIFSTDRRIGEEVWIERVGECIKEASYRPKVAVVDAISFSTDRSILLTGVGLYTGHQGVGYEVDVEILDSNNSLFKKKLTVPATGEANQFKVLVDVPIFIKAGAVYSITTVPHGQIGNYGRTCQPVCKTDTVTFTFSYHPKSWSTTARRGQIPRLYFRF